MVLTYNIKGKSTDGPISRYINRKISTRITKFIVTHNIPLTPNQVSLISFLLGVLGASLYLLGSILSTVLAGVIVQLSSIIDGVDGELARALNMTSKIGAFVDAMLDRIVDISVIMFLGLYVYTVNVIDHYIVLVITILAVTGSILVSYIHARGEASLGVHPLKIGSIPSIASRDVRLFIVFLASILSVISPIACIIGLLLIAGLSYIYVVLKTIDVYLNYKG